MLYSFVNIQHTMVKKSQNLFVFKCNFTATGGKFNYSYRDLTFLV